MATAVPTNVASVSGAGVDPKAKREIGDQAVWSLSSCKQGFGVAQLRDGKPSTYWQSDGPQPHMINLQFPKKTSLLEIGIYTDYKQDESYTPSKISVRAGTSFHDLQEISVIDAVEPEGWIYIPLNKGENNVPLRTNMIQIAILANHQNGRDTHVRLVSIFTSLTPLLPSSAAPFTTPECTAFGCLR
eukprot:m.43366 g.43366  ORF g.43366 m.43366 type:complete len:187 (+) comp19359_c0_seq1:109-669(+)